jgi:outer membrane protein OmpA-like peptidoglycan-associated protein
MGKDMNLRIISVITLLLLASCSKPVPGPDKTATGAVLAGGLGAGIGAIIGNQLGHSGPGIVLGVSFAAVSGILTGIGMDVLEGNQLQTNREIDSLKMLHSQNEKRLLYLEAQNRGRLHASPKISFLEVFFDEQRASLRLASVEQIAHIAEYLRTKRPGSYKITLKGFSTDFSSRSENQDLITARMKSVKNILRSNGVPKEVIHLEEVDLEKRKEDQLISEKKDIPERLNNRVELFITYL